MVLKAPLKNIDELTIDSAGTLTVGNTYLNTNGLFHDTGDIYLQRSASVRLLIGSALTGSTSFVSIGANSLLFPKNQSTASAPTAVEGGIFYDTTKDLLQIGSSAPAWKDILDESLIDVASGILGLDANKMISPGTANNTGISLGNATTEGSDIKIYRDASNNLQLNIDADAASNAKALDVYGGVVCQNYVTVGQTTLNTTYSLYVSGQTYISDKIISGSSIQSIGNTFKGNDNTTTLTLGMAVTGTDSNTHKVQLQVDSNDIIVAQADGDGAGGATNLKAIVYSPFFLDGTPQTLTGAGAVNLTTSTTHIVTDSNPDALTLADGAEGQFKMIVMKTDNGDGVLTPDHLGNGTTITFDDVGDSAFLYFTNSAWHFMGGTATLA